jgi:dTDP-4-dehydrorhamnose reductase
VGGAIAGALAADGCEVWGTHHSRALSIPSVRPVSMDLADPADVRRAADQSRPGWMVHAAAWPDLARCEREPAMARRINVEATAKLARACRDIGARLLHISTDQVFDGEHGRYRETDAPRPINEYGRTKLAAEHAAIDSAAPGSALVVRLGLVYALRPGVERSPVEQVLSMIRRGERPGLFTDEIRSPILLDDVVEAIRRVVRLAPDRTPSVLHLGGPEAVSRYEFGLAMAERFGFDPALIDARRQSEFASPARRPRDCSLDSRLAQQTLRFVPRGIREGLAALTAPDGTA